MLAFLWMKTMSLLVNVNSMFGIWDQTKSNSGTNQEMFVSKIKLFKLALNFLNCEMDLLLQEVSKSQSLQTCLK